MPRMSLSPQFIRAIGQILAVSYPLLALSTGARGVYQLCCKPGVSDYLAPAITTVAALLTIVGFSVNDTVVVSDRIRENLRKRRRDALPDVINASINETLSRTLITSGTAILVVVALLVLGGDVIRSFAFSLLVGFIAGVYSSVYVAAPLVLWMERWGSVPARTR